MTKITTLITIALFNFLQQNICVAQEKTTDVAQYVDPFWGASENFWFGAHTFSGATVPYGMVKLGPDCNQKITNSGYDPKGKIHGFSHVHVSGTGGPPKYGNILVMATSGAVNVIDYASDRVNEKATPGYFSVDYTTYDINASVTATHSVGFHKYRFNKRGASNILIDAGSFLDWVKGTDPNQQLVGSEVKITSNNEIQGYTRIRKGWGDGAAYTVYFYAVFDTPSASSGTWKSGKLYPGSTSQPDTNEPTGAYFTFNTKTGQEVKLKVAISFLGIEKAKHNLLNEANHWDFDKVKNDAYQAWNKELNKIAINTGTDTVKKIFYSALYHTMHQPTNRTGENPLWKSDKPYYDDFFCIWDTYRVTHPLLTLLDENRQVDMINSLIDIYVNEGYMPDAWTGNSFGMTQGGSNSDVLIADALVKGLTGIDYELALKAMIKNAEVPPGGDERKQGRGGLADYNTIGYISTDYERAGSRTMEYSFNDYCIGVVAKALNKSDIAEKYFKKAGNWKNIWNSSIEKNGAKGFIIPKRKDGTWQTDFNLNKGGTASDWLYEGNAWEYSFFVPHDVAQLISFCGGPEKFETRLDTFFINKSKINDPILNDFYNVSNEPDFTTPLFYNYIGKPYKSAERVRGILRSSFKLGIEGIPGNDDSGSMSGWYVFNTLGIFPVAGTDVYLIGSPALSKSTLTMANGKQVVIIAKNASEKNIYVQSCKLNGKPYNRSWFRHADIANGASFEFVMGDKPSSWSVKGALPPSMSDEK
ncbi:MAG: glycoside hydrolase family 92 protein [Pedobacter sp.]|nr:MAG: glycoside hydrolase family 92 protein [Pedobacter sp.]